MMSEVDIRSEVWTEFRNDLRIFSSQVGNAVQDGIEQATVVTQACSSTGKRSIKKFAFTQLRTHNYRNKTRFLKII